MIDLHSHSTASDGTYTPQEIIDLAIKNNVSALAITDHDTVDAIKEAKTYCAHKDIEFISGIEFSTTLESKEIHVVGLFIDEDSPALQEHLQRMQKDRLTRNTLMVQRLNELGYDITLEEVENIAMGNIITRAHFAKLLLQKKYFKEMSTIFEELLGCGQPGYVERDPFTPYEAIDIIHKSGGLAILAHPTLYNMAQPDLDCLVGHLKGAGLDGIEAYYSSYSLQDTQDMTALGKKYALLLSGGSDFHGDNRPGVTLGKGYGQLYIDEKHLDMMKRKLLK